MSLEINGIYRKLLVMKLRIKLTVKHVSSNKTPDSKDITLLPLQSQPFHFYTANIQYLSEIYFNEMYNSLPYE